MLIKFKILKNYTGQIYFEYFIEFEEELARGIWYFFSNNLPLLKIMPEPFSNSLEFENLITVTSQCTKQLLYCQCHRRNVGQFVSMSQTI